MIPVQRIYIRIAMLDKECQESAGAVNYDRPETVNRYIRAIAAKSSVTDLIRDFERGKL